MFEWMSNPGRAANPGRELWGEPGDVGANECVLVEDSGLLPLFAGYP